MAMSGVYGLERFGEYMAGLEERYAVIGGTACDMLLNASDLPFRATKDIDVVLMVEDRPAEVGRAPFQSLPTGGDCCDVDLRPLPGTMSDGSSGWDDTTSRTM